MIQWKRIEHNIVWLRQYALTWDACDLLLDKLPSTKHTESATFVLISECCAFRSSLLSGVLLLVLLELDAMQPCVICITCCVAVLLC